jgi:hypothetical protein
MCLSDRAPPRISSLGVAALLGALLILASRLTNGFLLTQLLSLWDGRCMIGFWLTCGSIAVFFMSVAVKF